MSNSNFRSNPLLLEINTFPFLHSMSQKYQHKMSLGEIPLEEWQRYADRGFDLIWLMGIWQRSPAARKLALENTELREAYQRALPDWSRGDVAGSPYSVYRYTPDKRLGRKSELAILKDRLNSLGLGLILDFVPNHLALDHAWTLSHPGRFIRVSRKAVREHPDWFYRTENGDFLAHGRDPHFAPWTDTAQVNFYSKDMRRALIRELLKIADAADGVRCDMALLGLNSVFQRTWGEVHKPRMAPLTEFWSDAISAVKARHPEFIFIAEVYWGLDSELRELGFDFTYDKVLYDRLRHDMPPKIAEYIFDNAAGLQQAVHFIENHDEPRAAEAFGVERSLAAAVAVCTMPGIRLLYDGQAEGKGIHLPVQLARAPQEEGIQEVARYYRTLLKSCRTEAFRYGVFTPLETDPAWEGNDSHDKMLCWCWSHEQQFKLVAINYSKFDVQARVRLPLSLENKNTVSCYDELVGETYNSAADEVREPGLYVGLGPWQSQVLDIKSE